MRASSASHNVPNSSDPVQAGMQGSWLPRPDKVRDQFNTKLSSRKYGPGDE